jgi:putative endonuclease
MKASHWLSKRLDTIRTPKQRVGDAAEEDAVNYLQRAGLILVQRSFVCKGGEIDLIMQDQQHLVFIEVRKRTSMQFGGAIASITTTKQKRMVHAARNYLQTLKKIPACRFDVIAIDGDTIQWLKNVITG